MKTMWIPCIICTVDAVLNMNLKISRISQGILELSKKIMDMDPDAVVMDIEDTDIDIEDIDKPLKIKST